MLKQLTALTMLACLSACGDGDSTGPEEVVPSQIDTALEGVLESHGFTGDIERTLEIRLGREIDRELAALGQALWFDKIGAMRNDNACGGCHAPDVGFGDTQSIAIGVENNNLVGPNRSGPRNQRRSPMVLNTAFFPKLMWNGRFFAPSGDPFENSAGFTFPDPEGTEKFPADHPVVTHLLVAQAHIPPTELVEAAGFCGTKGTIGERFDDFDDGVGEPLPMPDESGSRNEPIRQAVLDRLNASEPYRELFGVSFPSVAEGRPIDFEMFGQAIAEFEFTLTFADAPIDRFARGDVHAMTEAQKRGALLFFGKAKCVSCHAVSGNANEMFSDFENHVIGVPQVAPRFGVGECNMVFDGPGEDEDFGSEQITGEEDDRYEFRTSPLRNVALQPTFFHNGSYTDLAEAIRHHLDAANYARSYSAADAGLDQDLTHHQGPIDPVLARLSPILAQPIYLEEGEFDDLLAFVRDALLDERANKQSLCELVPESVPSGAPPLEFEGCR